MKLNSLIGTLAALTTINGCATHRYQDIHRIQAGYEIQTQRISVLIADKDGISSANVTQDGNRIEYNFSGKRNVFFEAEISDGYFVVSFTDAKGNYLERGFSKSGEEIAPSAEICDCFFRESDFGELMEILNGKE